MGLLSSSVEETVAFLSRAILPLVLSSEVLVLSWPSGPASLAEATCLKSGQEDAHGCGAKAAALCSSLSPLTCPHGQRLNREEEAPPMGGRG